MHWDRRRVLSLIAAVLAVLLGFVQTPFPSPTEFTFPTAGFGLLPWFAIAAAAGCLAIGRLRRAAYALLVACLILSVPEAAAFGAVALIFLLRVALLLVLIGLWRSVAADGPAPVDLRRLTVIGLAVAFLTALLPLDGPAFVTRLGVVAGGLVVGVLLLVGPWRRRSGLLTVLLLVAAAIGGCLAEWQLVTTTQIPPIYVDIRFDTFDELGVVPTVAAFLYVGLLRLPDVVPKTRWPRTRAGAGRVAHWLAPRGMIELAPIVVAAAAVLLPLVAIAARANQFAPQAPWSAEPAVGSLPIDLSTGRPAHAWPPFNCGSRSFPMTCEGLFAILIQPVGVKPASNAVTVRFTLVPPQNLIDKLPPSYTLYVAASRRAVSPG